MTVSCKDFLMHYCFSSISTCHCPVQAKQLSLQLKVNSNSFFTCKIYFKLNSNSQSFFYVKPVSVKTKSVLCPNRRSWIKTQTLQITILTLSFGNCLFVYHLVLKHLLQNEIRSSFCIAKVIKIGTKNFENCSNMYLNV